MDIFGIPLTIWMVDILIKLRDTLTVNLSTRICACFLSPNLYLSAISIVEGRGVLHEKIDTSNKWQILSSYYKKVKEICSTSTSQTSLWFKFQYYYYSSLRTKVHKVRYSGGKFGVIILPLLYENAYVELINPLYVLHRSTTL